MSWFATLSVRHKVTALALAASLLVLAVASAIFLVRERESARATNQQMLITLANILGEGLAVALDFGGDPRPVREALGHLETDAHLLLAAAYDTEGKLVADYVRHRRNLAVPERSPAPGARWEGDTISLTTVIQRGDRRIGTLHFIRHAGELRDQLNRTLVNTAIVAGIAAALGFLLSAALDRIVSEPVLRLGSIAHSVASRHDFTLRAIKGSPDEIGDLVDSFNVMLKELQTRDDTLADRTRQLSQTLVRLQGEITDRESSQRALHTAQEKLLLHVAHTPVAVINWNTQFEVVSWNPAAERIFGYTAAEAIGRKGPDLILPASVRPHVERVWNQLLRRAGGENSVNENTTKDGHTLTCEWFNTPLFGTDGLVMGVASFCTDISGRVSLEQQLRQSQKMQAVGQLAAGVAHDFNKLLTVIRGNASLLELSPTLSADDRLLIRELHGACTRATALVGQLLAFSRKQVIQPKALDLNELVTHGVKMLTRLLGEAITLEHQLAAGGCVPVWADRGMMDQVLINLAVNARDAMPNGGRLLVSTAVVNIVSSAQTANPDARPVRFSCLTGSDTGCGMSAETQTRIFEPFFTTMEVGKGTGLGLATVYGIVKQHDGWIEVTSAPNQGAAFTIFLPHHSATEPAVPERPGQNPALRGSETILLVEDEAAVRELGRRLLIRLGYHVIDAPAGHAALEIWAARKGEIQLLVTDMVMPGGISGMKLARRILAERPDLPVIYTSGYSPDLFTANSQIQEGRNFLAKPYSTNALARLLRTALAGRPG